MLVRTSRRASSDVGGLFLRRCSTNSSDYNPYRKIIGNREIVGYGTCGQPNYIDITDFPFPAIRYRECTPELMALREKERGDWRKLTIHEKKCLYRASFRQTFAEMEAPDTSWKCVIGGVLIGISIALWFRIFIIHKVYPVGPASFSRENRIAQYYREVALNMRPFTGYYRPPGAELRIHPKNAEILKEIEESSSASDN